MVENAFSNDKVPIPLQESLALLGTAGELSAELCKRFCERCRKNGNKKEIPKFSDSKSKQASVFGSNGGGLLEKTKIKCSRRVKFEKMRTLRAFCQAMLFPLKVLLVGETCLLN